MYIEMAIARGFDPGIFFEDGFSERQFNGIMQGLSLGVDVSKYADPRMLPNRMEQVRWALAQGLDVREFTYNLTWKQMDELRRKLCEEKYG
jgi:hypothetical protein